MPIGWMWSPQRPKNRELRISVRGSVYTLRRIENDMVVTLVSEQDSSLAANSVYISCARCRG